MVSPRALCGKNCAQAVALKPQRSPRWGSGSQRQTGKRRHVCSYEPFDGCCPVERNGTPDGEKTGKAWSMADSRKVTSLAISCADRRRKLPKRGEQFENGHFRTWGARKALRGERKAACRLKYLYCPWGPRQGLLSLSESDAKATVWLYCV